MNRLGAGRYTSPLLFSLEALQAIQAAAKMLFRDGSKPWHDRWSLIESQKFEGAIAVDVGEVAMDHTLATNQLGHPGDTGPLGEFKRWAVKRNLT